LTVANIRCDKDPKHLDVDKWRTKLSSDLQNCLPNTLRLLMAYGDDPEQLETVLQLKMKKKEQNDSDHPSKNCTGTSLDAIKKPLKRLKTDLDSNGSMPTLFQAVLDIKDDEIDVSFFILKQDPNRIYVQIRS
jgi:hypothetical protein